MIDALYASPSWMSLGFSSVYAATPGLTIETDGQRARRGSRRGTAWNVRTLSLLAFHDLREQRDVGKVPGVVVPRDAVRVELVPDRAAGRVRHRERLGDVGGDEVLRRPGLEVHAVRIGLRRRRGEPPVAQRERARPATSRTAGPSRPSSAWRWCCRRAGSRPCGRRRSGVWVDDPVLRDASTGLARVGRVEHRARRCRRVERCCSRHAGVHADSRRPGGTSRSTSRRSGSPACR